MPRQTLTKTTTKGPYPALPVAANSLDIPFTAADTVNKEQFVPSGNDLVLVWNTDPVDPHTVTFNSAPDEKKRTGDIPTYSIGAGEVAQFRFRKPGWRQSDGMIYMEASDPAIQYTVLQL